MERVVVAYQNESDKVCKHVVFKGTSNIVNWNIRAWSHALRGMDRTIEVIAEYNVADADDFMKLFTVATESPGGMCPLCHLHRDVDAVHFMDDFHKKYSKRQQLSSRIIDWIVMLMIVIVAVQAAQI